MPAVVHLEVETGSVAFLLELINAGPQFVILGLKCLLLNFDCLNHADRSCHVRVLLVTILLAHAGSNVDGKRVLFVVLELLLSKRILLFLAANFVYELALVEGVIGDHLASQVLNLGRQASFERLLLVPHDCPPNVVEVVEDF